MADKKHKTAAELRADGKALLEQAAQMGKDEVQELVHEIVERFQKIKQAIKDHELPFSLEDYFDDMEEDDVVEVADKAKDTKKKVNKKHLEDIKFLINDNDTETALFVAPTASKTARKRYKVEQKINIIKAYEAAKDGTKIAVLKAHGVKGNPIASWKSNADVKKAMQKIQEKK